MSTMKPGQRMAITAAIKMLYRAARALDRAGASELPQSDEPEWKFELARAGAAAAEASDRAIRVMEPAESAAEHG